MAIDHGPFFEIFHGGGRRPPSCLEVARGRPTQSQRRLGGGKTTGHTADLQRRSEKSLQLAEISGTETATKTFCMSYTTTHSNKLDHAQYMYFMPEMYLMSTKMDRSYEQNGRCRMLAQVL